MKIGYARVSTADQQASLQNQEETLKEFGCERVYTDIASDTNTKRPGLEKLKQHYAA